MQSPDVKENSLPRKITGENEEHCADVTPQKEITIADTHNGGGLDTILLVDSGTPKELKVGANRKTNRKYVVFEAQDTGITWGFSNSTQSFDIFKSQLIMVPVGENTEIWFSAANGTQNKVAIGEIS